ncbi:MULTISPECIES: SMI1/KNR4 family protein [Bacteria]|jgi:hypothetical protein|uniref:SMI1/KNR4 family protein n=1 Tax=Bacteria TaxID=2 RepID=UPI0018D971DD|nr:MULTISPECIES: SMI1/KNR4 family protein [Bacteria]MBH3376748.1 SMI1/KNR4 family protein [Pseudomonas juntendi]WKF80081.1 hypothetical protein QY877_04325 [Lactiplantibacillus plantarum]WKF88742.1 hypothetical protein QY875_05845 [Lactiplantibacillus plantarum]
MVICTEQHEAAIDASIEHVCKKLGISDASWIVSLWKRTDGALLNDQVLIYSVGDIEERNQTFEVYKNFKGMIAIGDDSGGRLILIKKNGDKGFILSGSANVSLDYSDRYQSLEELLRSLMDDQDDAGLGLGDILTKGGCKPSLEEIVSLKKMLGVGLSVVQLKALLGESGHVLLKSVYAQKYSDALVRFSHIIEFK